MKNTSCPDIFHCIEILLSFRIFEQLSLALKTEFVLNSLYWIYIFCHSGFLSNLRLLWKTRVALISFTVLKYFNHSGFLSNLRLPWKQTLPWIHCIEHIFFIIQDLWATCVCHEIFQGCCLGRTGNFEMCIMLLCLRLLSTVSRQFCKNGCATVNRTR